MADLIDRQELLNNRPEYLNPQMEDEIQSARHKGWNDCNSYYYDLIIKQPKADTEQHAQMKKDCKNCIHNEICTVWDDYNDEPCKDGYRGFCNNYDKFKDKSQYIELPCRIGDKVYYLSIKSAIPLTYKIVQAEVLNYNINRYGIFDAKVKLLNNSIFSATIDEIFLTKEEAEEKLKELNNEQD